MICSKEQLHLVHSKFVLGTYCSSAGLFIWVYYAYAMLCSKANLCPTLCYPMKPAGFSVPGMLQARILERIAFSSSRGSSWPRDQSYVSYTSCIGRWILYHWATWGTPACSCILYLYEVSILWLDFSTWTIEKHVLYHFLTLTVCENECSKSKKKRTTKKGKCKQ